MLELETGPARWQATPSPGEPLVSIVTPAYNEERLLPQCIESVLAQSYSHWNYTIVDNRSTDRTREIAARYAGGDPRIRVLTNAEFVPVIQNYNNAFNQISADSKYCKVVAADDYLFPDCLARMVSVAERHPTVGIVAAYCISGQHVAPFGVPYPNEVVAGRDAAAAYLLNDRYFLGNPSMLLFRSSFVRETVPFLNETRSYSDLEACLDILEAHDLGFVHEVLTFSRERAESETAIALSTDRYYVEELMIFELYGAKFLDPQRRQAESRWKWERYYRYLSTQVLARRDRAFWDAHRNQLAQLGFGLNRARLAAHVLVTIVERLARKIRW